MALALAGALTACVAPGPPPGPPEPLGESPIAPEDRPCYRVLSMEVRKSERALIATCEDGALRRIPVALGREPRGPKERRGDLRTPEGEYRISGPGRGSRYHLFLPFDYPSLADADAGLADGRIDPATHARIARAHENGVMPPQDTALGGLLGLHGEGPRWRGDSEGLDWTEGCIAMRDDAIAYLVARTAPGTPIRIVP